MPGATVKIVIAIYMRLQPNGNRDSQKGNPNHNQRTGQSNRRDAAKYLQAALMDEAQQEVHRHDQKRDEGNIEREQKASVQFIEVSD